MYISADEADFLGYFNISPIYQDGPGSSRNTPLCLCTRANIVENWMWDMGYPISYFPVVTRVRTAMA